MRTRVLLAAVAVAGLAACNDRPSTPPPPAPHDADADAGYVAAPELTAAHAQTDEIRLEGTAAAGARVRLAEPAGPAAQARANGSGHWRMSLPAAARPRILGLSMAVEGRVVQAQGYLLLTPAGRAILLRAGAGASAPGPAGAPRIVAFDFDRQGGAVLSGAAAPAANVSVRLDGRQVAVGRAGADGRFSIALSQPVASGVHQVEVVGDAFRSAAVVDTTPAAPLAGGPFRAVASAQGVRADWLTPGGGLQSTWIFD